MPQFRFRLASLHKLREAERDSRREALAEAYHAESVLYAQKDELEQQIEALRNESSKMATPGVVPVDRLIDNQRYEMVLRAEQQLTTNRMEQLAAEIERRRTMLVEADREVRLLERLRQRQQLRHNETEFRREIKRLDEIAGRNRQELKNE